MVMRFESIEAWNVPDPEGFRLSTIESRTSQRRFKREQIPKGPVLRQRTFDAMVTVKELDCLSPVALRVTGYVIAKIRASHADPATRDKYAVGLGEELSNVVPLEVLYEVGCVDRFNRLIGIRNSVPKIVEHIVPAKLFVHQPRDDIANRSRERSHCSRRP
jgi:hypothetical protein